MKYLFLPILIFLGLVAKAQVTAVPVGEWYQVSLRTESHQKFTEDCVRLTVGMKLTINKDSIIYSRWDDPTQPTRTYKLEKHAGPDFTVNAGYDYNISIEKQTKDTFIFLSRAIENTILRHTFISKKQFNRLNLKQREALYTLSAKDSSDLINLCGYVYSTEPLRDYPNEQGEFAIVDDIEFSEDDMVELPLWEDSVLIREQSAEDYYIVVDDMPEYPGGAEALKKFIDDNLKNPEGDSLCAERVLISFVIDTLGKAIDFTVLKGKSQPCVDEALRVLSLMPDWKPGSQNGRKVKVKMVIPVTFKP